MKKVLTLFFCCFWSLLLPAQVDLADLFNDSIVSEQALPVLATFKSPRVINAQSVETVHKHDLVFLVLHRFGDLAGGNGGAETFFGLDNSSDIQIGFDYGLTDSWSIGLGRVKGAPNGVNTFQRQLFYLNSKYRLLRQTTDERFPLSIALFGNSVLSGMKKMDLSTSDANFQESGDRWSFVAQLILARKFSPDFSLEILPTYIHRNLVTYMEQNDLFALGIALRMKVSRRMAVVVDYFHNFRSQESEDYFKQEKSFRFYNPLGVGLEIETGGHVFNMSFTNSTAILENQFIPSTSSSWGKGEFRWGFSISRTFSLDKSRRDAGY
ncbi:DUF5777 family beta-barrel protein [Mangrovibacterium lignilyticum]|uniref:DUF5777 family beta-barrel protein n=1 Tax=Mangrovibacterium lignilyticum TaxID=2668052 RepID=UPI0013D56B72|nr:DUF5777 family beta-barrel protein [Mangrovibacterium lignilyticum]